MDVYELTDFEEITFAPFPTDEEIEADIAAATARDNASCSAHYWCARFHFLKTQHLEPSVDILF